MALHNNIVFGAVVFLIKIVGAEEPCSNELGKSLICPSDDDPDHYTKCCWNATSVYCCPREITPVVQDDNLIVMIIGLTVILTCLSVAVIIVVCCFWSRCPLYDMCRVNYTYGDIVAYSKLFLSSVGIFGILECYLLYVRSFITCIIHV